MDWGPSQNIFKLFRLEVLCNKFYYIFKAS